MKKVFSNSAQTIHVWAQQTQSEGRSSNVFFEGATVYSYGRHYPLGTIVTNKKGEKAAIINASGYSVTTQKHIREARQAVNHYTRFSVYDTEAMKAIAGCSAKRNGEDIVMGLSNSIIHAINCYYSRLRTDRMKRKAATLDKWKDATLSKCNNYIELLEWFDLKMTKDAKKALAQLSGLSPAEAREAAQKAAALEAKKRAKAEAERNKENAVIINEAANVWVKGLDSFILNTKNGMTHYCRDWTYRHTNTFLRIKGDDIETSKGASFPVKHAILAFNIIQNVMSSEKAWIKNGKTIHLGNFQIDRIEPSGTVIAGCHTVEYSEIKRIASQLNLI